MARPLRIEYPNATYHVSNQSVPGKRVFADASARQLFLQGLEEACRRFNVTVHVYALFSTEYHLLLTTPEGNLSRFMRQLDGVFTQNYQKTRRGGGVFRSRYKAVLVQASQWLGAMSLLLHRKAQSRKGAESSLDWYLKSGKGPDWLDKQSVLDNLGLSARQTAAYGKLLDEPEDETLAAFYNRKNLLSILGDDRFRASARKKQEARAGSPRKTSAPRGRPSVKTVVAAVAAFFNVEEGSIYKAARGPGSRNLPRWAAMYLCQEVSGVTLRVIAERFGLQRYGTVSTTIGKLKAEMEEDPRTAARIVKLYRSLA